MASIRQGSYLEQLEELFWAVRFSNIDMSATVPLDISREVPCWPET
jgi:hypothetical protein